MLGSLPATWEPSVETWPALPVAGIWGLKSGWKTFLCLVLSALQIKKPGPHAGRGAVIPRGSAVVTGLHAAVLVVCLADEAEVGPTFSACVGTFPLFTYSSCVAHEERRAGVPGRQLEALAVKRARVRGRCAFPSRHLLVPSTRGRLLSGGLRTVPRLGKAGPRDGCLEGRCVSLIRRN